MSVMSVVGVFLVALVAHAVVVSLLVRYTPLTRSRLPIIITMSCPVHAVRVPLSFMYKVSLMWC